MSSPLPFDISLWDFSLHQYSRTGVSDACIALQDEEGINVNVLLWSLWLGHKGLDLDATLLKQATGAIHSWDANYVVPLRQLRRRLKTEFGTGDVAVEAVRTQIKQAELFAEKHLQRLLQNLVREKNHVQKHLLGRRELMRKNLKSYLGSYSVCELKAEELIGLID